MEIAVPKKLVEKAEELGVDLQGVVVEALAKALSLDPEEEAEAHLELAKRYLREGEKLAGTDPVQASEKLYKAAEECVKAAAKLLSLREVLERVKARGRWTVTDLERAVAAASKKLGEELRIGWDAANYLHVWGFLEAKLDQEAVKARLPYVEKAIGLVEDELARRRTAKEG